MQLHYPGSLAIAVRRMLNRSMIKHVRNDQLEMVAVADKKTDRTSFVSSTRRATEDAALLGNWVLTALTSGPSGYQAPPYCCSLGTDSSPDHVLTAPERERDLSARDGRLRDECCAFPLTRYLVHAAISQGIFVFCIFHLLP